jgi:hypothetical protein
MTGEPDCPEWSRDIAGKKIEMDKLTTFANKNFDAAFMQKATGYY